LPRRKKEELTFRDEKEALRYLGETLAVQSASPSLKTYQPHDKQQRFHKSEKKIRLYIGGNRSGKTLGGVAEDLWWLNKTHPYMRLPVGEEPVRGRVVAVDFLNGIDKIILPQFSNMTPKSMLVNGSWEDSYDKQARTLTFRNNSFVEFMSYDQDLDKFAGTSRHFVHLDEEPPKPIYTENFARVVDTNGRMWMTMTPVDGMTWVYDTIYEPGILGTSRNVSVTIVDMFDNPHVSEESKQDFLESLDEEEREARIHGKFIQMGGLIYKVFDPTPGGVHVVDKQILPPDNWEVIMGLDHGFNNPTAVGFHMVSPEGDIITFAEHYERGLTVAENAEKIKLKIAQIGRMPDIFIADPSIRNKDPITGTSIQEEYRKAGLNFMLGNNDVRAGIVRVNGYLKPRITASGKKVRAKYHITTNCPSHIKEFTKYRWKTYKNKADQFNNNVFEEPHKKDDHAMDELRYVINSRPELFAEDTSRPDNSPVPDVSVPSSVNSYTAKAKDFRTEPHVDGMTGEYAGDRESTIEYDEHVGGVW
jgi:phage terminase large subunit-like protein